MLNKQTTFLDAVKWGQQLLAGNNIENARMEAETLLAFVTGRNRGEIYMNFPLPISSAEFASFKEIIIKRAAHYPLQYIIGSQEFMSLEFHVTPDVLIPRQDTEILVEKVIELAARECCPKILDLCTGSGAVAVSLAKHFPRGEVFATDISEAALEIARENAANNKVRVQFEQGSLFEPVKGMHFDIVVANPPYIPAREINKLMPEVKNYEPLMALDGGEEGLDFYGQIIRQSPDYLMPGGILALEIGFDQATRVKGMCLELPQYKEVNHYQDYGGRDRVVIAVC